MEEIRKRRLVRGESPARFGDALDRRGWSFGDASFRGYAIDCQRSIFLAVRAQAANSWRNGLS